MKVDNAQPYDCASCYDEGNLTEATIDTPFTILDPYDGTEHGRTEPVETNLLSFVVQRVLGRFVRVDGEAHTVALDYADILRLRENPGSAFLLAA